MTSTRTPGRTHPARWVPTLYFAEGVPFFAVALIAGILYKRLGLRNDVITFYTSLLLLPWSLKPLWSPLIEMFKTKKFFVVFLELAGGLSLVLVALCLPLPKLFRLHAGAAGGGGVLLFDPRHRRRRLVYRQPFPQRAGGVYRMAGRLLQRGAVLLAGRPDHPGGFPGAPCGRAARVDGDLRGHGTDPHGA